jgi:hypothetical protein
MFRKFLLAGVAGLALLTPLAMTAPVQAAHPPFSAHHCSYHVMYRSCGRDPWVCYATYAGHDEAYRVARHLRHQGYQTRVAYR